MRNYVKTICQLPVSTLLYLVVLAEHGLTWCLGKLSNPLSPVAGSLLKRIVKSREPEKEVLDVRPNVVVFRDWLESQDDEHVEAFRIHIESEFSVPVKARKKNAHLYAVSRPNREENIRRIANSLCAMNTIELQHWLSDMRKVLQ